MRSCQFLPINSNYVRWKLDLQVGWEFSRN
jgi:hypothetical protein